MKISIKLICCFFLTSLGCFSQDVPPADLDGEELRTWLKQNWYDGYENISSSASSGYRAARLEMYNYIDVVDDKLTGFYSGYVINVPSQGFDTPSDISPMDCEHIVPQSLFNSSAPMRNDIFHLRPTYSNWNSTRSNLPFGENPDLETDKWMRFDNQIQCSGSESCLPNTNIIDEYSEVINGQSWEPREIVKGDVARAVFYFFTMYPQYDIDFVGDIEELYEWHLNDPADEQELNRNDLTEDYQGNRNPYIDNADWVRRAWLPNVDPPVTSSNTIAARSVTNVYPVPTTDFVNVELADNSGITGFQAFNILGETVKTGLVSIDNGNHIRLSVEHLRHGTYFMVITFGNNEQETVKFVVH